MKKSRSIRRRITTVILTGLCLLCIAIGIAVIEVSRKYITVLFDRSLTAQGEVFSSLVTKEFGTARFSPPAKLTNYFDSSKNPIYFQIWNPDKTILAKSSSLQDDDLPYLTAHINRSKIRDITLPDGKSGRAITIRFIPTDHETPTIIENTSPGKGKYYTLVLAVSREPLNKLKNGSVIYTILAIVIICIGSGLIVWIGTKRGLRPLNVLANQANEIGPEDLTKRFHLTSLPAELSIIYIRLNDLLDRLERAFQRERRFTGNLSHELRTPLSEIRTSLEIANKFPEDIELRNKALSSSIESVTQIEHLFASLVAQVRLQESRFTLNPETVNLEKIVSPIVTNIQSKEGFDSISLITEFEPNVTGTVDKALFAAVIRNLVHNAFNYTVLDTWVKVEIRRSGDHATLSVSNPVNDINQDNVDLIFEPFWRADESRGETRHFGLGLSLTQDYCKLQNIKIESELSDKSVLTIRLIIMS